MTRRVLTALEIGADCYGVHGEGAAEDEQFWVGFWKEDGDVEISDDGIEHISRENMVGIYLREEVGISQLYLKLRASGDWYELYIGRLSPDSGNHLGLQKEELESWVGFVKRHYLERFGMEI